MRRKFWSRIASVVASMALGVGLLILSYPLPSSAEKITFSLGWVPNGRDAAFFAAKAEGFYQEAGLNVTIIRGFGGAAVVQKVGAKAVEFGFGDVGRTIIGRAKGEVKVKQLLMYHAKTVYAIHTLKQTGIRTPKDLEGRRLGGPAGDSTWAVLPALAAANGVDLKKIKIEPMSPAATVPSLLAGKVDGISMFITSTPVLIRKARPLGKEVFVLRFVDWGVDMYNTGVIGHNDTLTQKPDLTRRFIRATAKGLKWAIENPEGAIAHFVKVSPEADKALHLDIWRRTMDSLLTPTMEREGLGHMSEKKWRYTRDLIVKAYKLSVSPPVAELYTNAFLPRLFAKMKKAR